MVPVLLWEFVEKEQIINKIKKRSYKIKDFLNLFLIILSPVGILIYAIYNFFKWNDPLFFIHAHGELANGRSTNGVILFPQTIYRYLKIIAAWHTF